MRRWRPRAVSEPDRDRLQERSCRGMTLNAPKAGGSQLPAVNGAWGRSIVPRRAFKTAATVRLKGSGRQLLVVTLGIAGLDGRAASRNVAAAVAHMVAAKFHVVRWPADPGMRASSTQATAASVGAALDAARRSE